ncbi:ETC complex I subunit [Prosthecomicrobium hirschii]|uniref:ETC complex I subunit n=1 Tax=Prosthecodimorpha hirschii TaxID=665126 RepID=A0A0N8GFX0_9HYPH|nr:ETC complex I subunit [Prosthecomicrobium hirschii]KPL55497.1 ETC complex I subunit [Prosthecomicrobium hirschii]MCW1839531.1 ETC complex I subunit [Prosthecomicrobium hirschii]TPQ49321.1 ETC complex I subunit [Prosthecomicrobium hirschii]
MVARIYKPAKNAMQSGQAKTKRWCLDYEPEAARSTEPLMGWTSSSDMRSQLKLFFAEKEDAVAYCEKNGIPYTVQEPHERKPKTISYSDNFKFGRIGHWTH